MIRRCLLVCLSLIVGLTVVQAQSVSDTFESFHWEPADVSFLAPTRWTARQTTDSDAGTVTMTFTAPDGASLAVIAYPEWVAPDELLPELQAAAERNALAVSNYDDTEWFGQTGYLASGPAAQAVAARLPDGRAILVLGSGSAADLALPVLHSLTFSARSAPTPTTYRVFWGEMLPEPVSFTDVTDPRIAGLAVLADGRLVATDAARGLVYFRPGTPGAEVIPFPNPSQPSGLALDNQGRLIVSDPVCRCLQVYAPTGWDAPIGAFAGGAPHHVAASPDGTLYAIDGDAAAYQLWIQSDGAEERIPLTFNAAAPPLLAAGGTPEAPRLYVIEWLASLIDGNLSAAVSDMRDGKLTLLTWLPVAPDQVRAATVMPEGALAVALADGRIMRVEDDGSLTLLADDSPQIPRALVATAEGALYTGTEAGTVVGRQLGAAPDRTGDGSLHADVPAQATIGEALPAQTFTYAGRAGEVITVNATDLQRTGTLDMALTLTGTDGATLAENDDQLGADLYNGFDSQLPAVSLPTDGTYTITLSPIGGEGTVTVGVSPDRAITLSGTEPTRLTGAIQDVFPAQRWILDGRAGQTLTITMIAQSGDLDPRLELFTSDGRRLALNDDAAEDLTLGVNAQLFRIPLPRDERYILKAGRYEGSGTYELIILPNN